MYVAVKGGETAILNSHSLLAEERRGDPALPELSVAQIREQMGLAVDRVMTEGSLYDPDLAALAKDTGIKPWTFDQREGDAVFVPAGCAHQVRNLRSCLKVALDFVSPESAGECLVLARGLPHK